jgi:hypothetical protein
MIIIDGLLIIEDPMMGQSYYAFSDAEETAFPMSFTGSTFFFILQKHPRFVLTSNYWTQVDAPDPSDSEHLEASRNLLA